MIDQTTGETLLRLTIRIAVVCYLWRSLLQIRIRFREVSCTQCALWCVGCLFYVLHVGFAFAYIHDWSHQAALQHTADETERLIGLHRGDGLWVNYVFSIIWIADVIRISAACIRGRKTNQSLDFAVAALFAFIFFNATVVFGPPVYRLMAVPVAVLATFVWYRSGRVTHPLGRRG